MTKSAQKRAKPIVKPQSAQSKSASSKKQLHKAAIAKSSNPFINSPLYDVLKVFERPQDQWAARYILILSVILLKAAVGLGSFSGQGEKPINGDFEAQRHWMELTVHLPLKSWYSYDLQYWGLDYPPLTAYHSWLFGKVGSFINPEWFELVSSRGIENPQLKNFMRISCLISELIIYFPAVMQLASYLGGKKENMSRMHQVVILALIFCQPSLILIDNGHFQYNAVMLGLFLLSVIDLLKGNLILASIWFVCSILFKQMALYYSPFIFAFILSKLFTPKKTLMSTVATLNISKLISVGLTVAITTIVILLPFLVSARSATEAVNLILQIITRMFPFERGLFEDKVANFWCTTNIVVKYASKFSASQLKAISLALTLLGALPPCVMAFWKNIRNQKTPPELVIYGFAATAWAFYLFSFQVHEKTVLVPLIPSTFLLLSSNSSEAYVVQWINNVATFSLFPLLKRDGLGLQYTVCLFLINWLLNGFQKKNWINLVLPKNRSFVFRSVIFLSYVAMLMIHAICLLIDPPSRYPDLWTIANTTVSFGCFMWFYMWLVCKMYHL